MCELFGYSADHPIQDTDLLVRFYKNSVVHKDGWGLYKSGCDYQMLYRDTRPAHESARFQWMLEHNRPAHTAIGHIRYATVGNVNPANVHPFQMVDREGRMITLAHNGNCPAVKELDPLKNIQRGTTDSERILLFLIGHINRVSESHKGHLPEDARIRIYDDALSCLSRTGRINVLISDGDLFIVRCNIKDRLHAARGRDGVFFSTRPLNRLGLDFEDMPIGRTLVFRGGKLLYMGEERGKIFEPLACSDSQAYLFDHKPGLTDFGIRKVS